MLNLGDGDDLAAPYEASQGPTGPTEHIKSSPLEREFSLPLESRFRPAFAPTLPTELKKFQVWEPKESRSALLKEWRFVFLTGSFSDSTSSSSTKPSGDDAEFRGLVESAGAAYETLDVSGGRVRMKQAIGRCVRKFEAEKKGTPGGGASGKGLAIVSLGDVERTRASVDDGKAAGNEWSEIVEVLDRCAKTSQVKEANYINATVLFYSFRLGIAPKDAVVQSIIDISTLGLDSFEIFTNKCAPTCLVRNHLQMKLRFTAKNAERTSSDGPTSAHPDDTLAAPPPTPSTSITHVVPTPAPPTSATPEPDAVPSRKRPVRRVTRSRANTPAPDASVDAAPMLPTPAPSAGVNDGSNIDGADTGDNLPPRRACLSPLR